MGGTLRAKAGVGGQELLLEIAEKGVVSVETLALHLQALSVRGELMMDVGQTIRIKGLLDRDGVLRLTAKEAPAPGQVLRIFEAGESQGSWSKVELPSAPPGRRWDLGALETDGSIRLE
jgi:hypothetical protein